MTDSNEDPRIANLRARGQNKLDKLYDPVLQATRRACAAYGISEQTAMENALRAQNGFEILESAGIDQLCREASDGDKESAKVYDEWHRHSFPHHIKYRGQR